MGFIKSWKQKLGEKKNTYMNISEDKKWELRGRRPTLKKLKHKKKRNPYKYQHKITP